MAMTGPVNASLSDALNAPGVRQLADLLRDHLRAHEVDCCCEQWLTHHSQVLAPFVAAYVEQREREAAATALSDTADAWQWGAWGNTPRHADRVADRIGAAQYVTTWLRDRARAAATGEQTATLRAAAVNLLAVLNGITVGRKPQALEDAMTTLRGALG